MFKILLLQGSLAAGSAVGGIAYDATGPGGAAISSPPAGFGDLAREGGREAPAPSQGAIGGAGEGAQRTR